MVVAVLVVSHALDLTSYYYYYYFYYYYYYYY